jgi:hypothetical protein
MMPTDPRTIAGPVSADRLEVVLDPAAAPGNVVPALARLLRRLRDKALAAAGGEETETEERQLLRDAAGGRQPH